jgi:tRNA(Arg) A34 adenosine deaminase TadA
MRIQEHKKFMRRCIELAQDSLDSGDNPFGSVVVKDNEIIAEARNSAIHNDITDHARSDRYEKSQKSARNFGSFRVYTLLKLLTLSSVQVHDA